MKHYFYNREQIENKKSSVFFLLFFGVNKNLKHEADHNIVPSSRLINNFYLGILTVVSGAGGRTRPVFPYLECKSTDLLTLSFRLWQNFLVFHRVSNFKIFNLQQLTTQTSLSSLFFPSSFPLPIFPSPLHPHVNPYLEYQLLTYLL